MIRNTSKDIMNILVNSRINVFVISGCSKISDMGWRIVTCENILLQYLMQEMCNWKWCIIVELYPMIVDYVFTKVEYRFTLVEFIFNLVEYKLILL